MSPIFFCIIATISWGVWGFCENQAAKTSNPVTVQYLNLVFSAVFIPAYFIYINNNNISLNISKTSIIWIVFGVLANILAATTFLFALSKGNSNTVVPFTATYPVVTLLLSFFFFQENLTLKQIIGICFSVLGVFLIL